MPDSNDPSRILDPRLGSLMISSVGRLDVTGRPMPRFGADKIVLGPPAAEGEAGTLGHYRLIHELGRGGMGAVFLALDTRLDRQLALKVMLPEFAANAEAKERFLREARAAARISHDHVVTVFEADERDGVPYIAMQLLQGYPLDAFLQKKGNPSLRNVVRIAREAALGLAAAHKLGIVHRDIKPANLWLEAPRGRVKLLDFGLAQPVGPNLEFTKSGAVVGTPAFMAPEQALGERVDHRADLFSLGAVLYLLGTGQIPFPEEDVAAMLRALTTTEPKPVRALNDKIPEVLAELIHRLLAKNPDERPQTAVAVANRLQEISEQSASLASAAPTIDPSGARAGSSDSWTSRAVSGGEQRGAGAAAPGAPGAPRSMLVVAVTPTTLPEEVQEEAPKPATRSLHTVISSGDVRDERQQPPRARVREETEAESRTRPRRRRARWEEEEEEEARAESPDRPRRKRAGKVNVIPILIGAAGVVLFVAFVAVALLVVVWDPKAPNSAQKEVGDHTGVLDDRQGEPPPKAPDTNRPVAPIAKLGAPDAVLPPARDPEPTILGSIPHDPKFKTIGPEGALLIGLMARFEKFGDRDIVRAVRPIYRVNGQEEFGKQFGDDMSGAVTMKAKDGYAVGGITGKAGPWCNGFSLTYMRVKPDGSLDTGDSYEGAWGGFDGPSDTIRVASDGRAVVGIVGKIVGPKTTALGLLFRGQEGWNPGPNAAEPMSPKETIIGANNDPTFRDDAPPGGLLIGFDVWYGAFANYDVIDGVRPLYRTAGKESIGQIYGQETARGIRVFAKPGYAVGALNVKAGLGLDSITITFMKVRGGGLNPDDSYQSDKLGGPGGGSHPTLGGDGTPVTGIIGRKDNVKVSGLGLAFSTAR